MIEVSVVPGLLFEFFFGDVGSRSGKRGAGRPLWVWCGGLAKNLNGVCHGVRGGVGGDARVGNSQAHCGSLGGRGRFRLVRRVGANLVSKYSHVLSLWLGGMTHVGEGGSVGTAGIWMIRTWGALWGGGGVGRVE